jgi:hypothetical protein
MRGDGSRGVNEPDIADELGRFGCAVLLDPIRLHTSFREELA